MLNATLLALSFEFKILFIFKTVVVFSSFPDMFFPAVVIFGLPKDFLFSFLAICLCARAALSSVIILLLNYFKSLRFFVVATIFCLLFFCWLFFGFNLTFHWNGNNIFIFQLLIPTQQKTKREKNNFRKTTNTQDF